MVSTGFGWKNWSGRAVKQAGYGHRTQAVIIRDQGFKGQSGLDHNGKVWKPEVPAGAGVSSLPGSMIFMCCQQENVETTLVNTMKHVI